MGNYETVEVELTKKLYNTLKNIADRNGQDVKDLIEDYLEEYYG